jgi:hypothetical protein
MNATTEAPFVRRDGVGIHGAYGFTNPRPYGSIYGTWAGTGVGHTIHRLGSLTSLFDTGILHDAADFA